MEINNISSNFVKIESIATDFKISKFRNYASQIYATFATNLVKFTTGAFYGFTTVLVAELYKENAEIHMSTNALSWFSSFCFMAPIGCLILGILAQRIGARLAMLITAVVFTIACLIFYFATNVIMLLSAQILAGFVLSALFSFGISYVVEISQPQLRGSLTASATFSSMCAAFLVVFLSNFLHWRTIALVILVFPILGFMAVYTIPESPYWLASKQRFFEAELALCWLRGWSRPENIFSEFNKLKETYKSSHDKLDCPETMKNDNSNRLSSFRDNFSSYLHRSFYVPFTLMCLLVILHSCTGYSPMIIYSIVIFRQINAPIDPHVAASIFDCMRIIGALFCILTIHYTGKKKLAYFTLTGAGLAHITVSTALWLKEYQFNPEICQWIAVVSMTCTTCLSSAGIDKIVFILNGEIFPTKCRFVGSGMILFVSSIANAICVKTFLPLMDAVTLPGVFIYFGTSCLITCVVFHFMFPETEGKTLREIEEYYQGVKSNNNERSNNAI